MSAFIDFAGNPSDITVFPIFQQTKLSPKSGILKKEKCLVIVFSLAMDKSNCFEREIKLSCDLFKSFKITFPKSRLANLIQTIITKAKRQTRMLGGSYIYFDDWPLCSKLAELTDCVFICDRPLRSEINSQQVLQYYSGLIRLNK